MPELPEVEFAARELRAAAVGRTIVAARVMHPALRRTLPTRDARQLIGKRVVAVERRGKHQLVRLDDGSVLHVHFRMAGDWLIDHASAELPRHARLVLELDDCRRISLVDSRALSAAQWGRGEPTLPPMGLEAIDPLLDGQVLAAALARKRGPIKPALLDQRTIAGVGNIYASEALWRARIDPRRPASTLGAKRLARLADAIRETMRRALEHPARYYSEDEVRFDVYDREGEPCPRCGSKIKRIVQAGRSTYYCPREQR
jgi:formamidopyrimidine-DNA glycosylase